MAFKNQVPNVYSVGLRSVGSYQVSGTPWLTGSASLANTNGVRFSFPYVSKSLTVINTGTVALRLHFQSGSELDTVTDGVAVAITTIGDCDVQNKLHYITVPASNGSVTLDVKCKEFYISNHAGGAAGSFEAFAELTNIPTGSMFTLTGSGITG